jgi:mannonate dehydratase
MVDYFSGNKKNKEKSDQPVGDKAGWGRAGTGELWSLEELLKIKKEINAHDLVWEAIENFDPSMWHDVLLDGPKKLDQLELLKEQIRIAGEAGIPVFGYNFSIAGVTDRITGPFARGGAISAGMKATDESPIPRGMVWNMVYDADAPQEFLPDISHEELWSRLEFFLDELIPVAEKAGVILAAHPDDPPMPVIRNTPRLVYQPHMYQKLIDLKPSPSNTLEFCLGTISEMTEGDVYEATDNYSKQNKLAYVHCRNVVGKVPDYREVFIDEGDIDMLRILRILKKNNFEGVIIPDHTPQMSSAAPWHTGMAYAMGYLKALITVVKAGGN